MTGTVYGTIVAAAVVAATASANASEDHVILSMLLTSVVFWAAHVFSRVLALSMELGRSLSRVERREVASNEWPMIAAAVPLLIPLMLGWLGVLDFSTATWLALTVAVLVLGGWGLRIGVLEGRGLWRTVQLSLISASFGLLIVALKALVSH
jgi:hypothetical protein